MKLVKIGRQGRAIKEYAMNDSASFNDLLKACGEAIGPEDQIAINGNVQPLDRCDMNALLVGNSVFIIMHVPPVNKITVKMGRVGDRLFSVSVVPGSNAMSILTASGMVRMADEKLFLKKSNDSHYDEDITSREYSYRPIEGDILVIEKIKIIDPRYPVLYDFLNWLNEEWNIGEGNSEIEAAVKYYLKN
jgi:hypothetical protein